MEIKIISKKISQEELLKILKDNFEKMAKVDIDIEREILSIGGEWHSEGDDLLVRNGSSSKNIWGVNFYPFNTSDERIEYVSLINLKPAIGHKNMEITDKLVKEKVKNIIGKLLLNKEENLNDV